ncbi:MAG: ribose-phosphate pyrophosphokinase [Armatimonadetes bacterium]|nr:ribose-phosphate pyrophosphokinase [Armatimonadota bacterium]
MEDRLQVFAGRSNPALAQEICDYLGIPLGQVSIQCFSNDNIFIQIQESVREKDVFVMQSFSAPASEHILELLIMLDALRGASARRITAVIPYFSYARSDKKDHPRISIAGRLMADLLVAAGADRVLTMTLHSPQVHGFFRIPLDHLTAAPVIADYFEKMGLEDCVALAPDAGSAKRAGDYAVRLHIPMAFIDKRRVSDRKVEIDAVVGNVREKNVLIFDDEIAAASSMVGTVEAIRKYGIKNIYAGATHGVFCGPAIERLRESPIHQIVVTNTVARGPEKHLDKIKTLSVAPLFGEAIKRIHTGESVGAMFTDR